MAYSKRKQNGTGMTYSKKGKMVQGWPIQREGKN